MRNQEKPIIIFSVNESSLSDSTNRDRHEAYALSFKSIGLQFKSLLGCYKGDCEESFLVIDTPENRAFVTEIARRHNQQSILFADENRIAELLYLNINSRQPVGKLIPAAKAHALEQDNWTFDPETEIFYTTV